MRPGTGEAQAPPPEYGDPAFWEGYYAAAGADGEEDTYEWLLGWDRLAWLLEPLLARDTARSVLHLGCGNSALSEDMYEAGYKQQTSVDISPSVIAHMASRNSARPEMRWIAADATDLAAVLPSDEFALVVDKSTLDALFCHDDHALVLTTFLKEAFRVTAPNGVYACISMHDPRDVLPWLRRRAFHWRVRWVQLPDEETSSRSRGPRGPARRHHLYICSKRGPAAAPLAAHWPALAARVAARPDSDLSSESCGSSGASSREGSSDGGGGGGGSGRPGSRAAEAAGGGAEEGSPPTAVVPEEGARGGARSGPGP